MTEVNALKARIVELERQSVKSLNAVIKSNERLLELTTLARWGDEKPDVGRGFMLYLPDCGWAIGAYRSEEKVTAFMDKQPDRIPDNARWCYVPSAPDWDKEDL